MATSLATLINQTRRELRDWPDGDALTASVASTGTTLTVADGTLYYKNWQLEIDQEVFTVAANGSGTSVTVRRGAKGSTAASHASSSVVLIRPHFYAVEIIDKLNAARNDMYPQVYKPVLDTSLTTSANTYEYTVPNMPSSSTPIPYLSKVEGKRSGAANYETLRDWWVKRGATPKIQFQREPEANMTLRVHGYGPFPNWTAISDEIDTLFPANLEQALPVGAASFLLASGEAGRVREDVLPTDDREQANRTGSSMTAANALYNRFLRMVANGAPPPLPPHVKPTF